MAQNCCDRDRTTWLDMHSNFKMAQIFFPFVLRHFEVQSSKWPKLQNGQNFKIAQLSKWPKLQNGSKQKGKIFGPFWSLNAYQVTWFYLCHSSFGPFWGIPRNFSDFLMVKWAIWGIFRRFVVTWWSLIPKWPTLGRLHKTLFSGFVHIHSKRKLGDRTILLAGKSAGYTEAGFQIDAWRSAFDWLSGEVFQERWGDWLRATPSLHQFENPSDEGFQTDAS